jgi:hypothetical protein
MNDLTHWDVAIDFTPNQAASLVLGLDPSNCAAASIEKAAKCCHLAAFPFMSGVYTPSF